MIMQIVEVNTTETNQWRGLDLLDLVLSERGKKNRNKTIKIKRIHFPKSVKL